jgi:hypothetical protein
MDKAQMGNMTFEEIGTMHRESTRYKSFENLLLENESLKQDLKRAEHERDHYRTALMNMGEFAAELKRQAAERRKAMLEIQ